ncbi:hypothetical protein [Brevundimonas sp. TWP2-3-4b1]|uniref:hypothetical protein n=1 Tax=Brevundimonas sp. TWP2-3-4b1 TaxID=2804580 RepID=UPI003CF9D661
MPTITGTIGNDTLTGFDDTTDPEAGTDTISGLGGNDTINGLGGTNTLYGNEGDDVFLFTSNTTETQTVNGGSGVDVLDFTALGARRLSYGDFTDGRMSFNGDGPAGTPPYSSVPAGTPRYTWYATEVERLVFGAQDDTVTLGGFLSVTADLGGGNDFGHLAVLGYQANSQTPFAHGAGGSTINGGDGNDFLRATFNGPKQTGTLNGDGGNDTFVIAFGTKVPVYGSVSPTTNYASDTFLTVNGGTGRDLLSLEGPVGTATGNEAFGVRVNIDLRAGSFSILSNVVSFSSIEDVNSTFGGAITGTAGDNELRVTGFNAVDLFGLGGNDRLFGGAAGDILDGGDGDDYLVGGAGADRLVGGAGNDVMYGGEAGSSVSSGQDVLNGGDGDDQLFGSGTLDGGAGNDIIRGSGILIGGQGDDQLSGSGSSEDTLRPGAGQNFVSGGEGPYTSSPDTVEFSYSWADADIRTFLSGMVITNPNGVDTLDHSIERFQFSDVLINNYDGNYLVDDLYYLTETRDFNAPTVDAEASYNSVGWRMGRDPNPLFDTSAYLAAYRDVAAGGNNPLDHYRLYGWREGRDPSLAFDTEQYLARNPQVRLGAASALEHYLIVGRYEGRQIYAAVGATIVEGFDRDYYLMANEDVARSGMDPYQHFIQYGWREGRDPNAYFDVSFYLDRYVDVRAAGVDPLQHFYQFGYAEGRDPSALFNSTYYASTYRDVGAAGVNGLEHYLEYGRLEGRNNIAPPSAASADMNSGSWPVLEMSGEQADSDLAWVLPALEIERSERHRMDELGLEILDVSAPPSVPLIDPWHSEFLLA